VLTEVCDDSNQAAGFAVLGVEGGLSRLIGPSLGSFLAQPSDKYVLFRNAALFQDFPYLLPCLVGMGVGMVAATMVVLFIPETLSTAKGDNTIVAMSASETQPLTATATTTTTGTATTTTPGSINSSSSCCNNNNNNNIISDGGGQSVDSSGGGASGRMCTVLRTRNIMIAVALYASLGMIGVVVDECFPLWVLTSVESGGFNFTSTDIGR
jgi:hypothetical protein